jgi:hypothetical protein
MPPGAIGSQQLQRGGPLTGFFQPVEIKAPPGALVSLAVTGNFETAQTAPRKAGLLIGAVYRLRVTNIPLAEGIEVFPTVEVIDRLYAPVDQERRFAIPVDISAEDLRQAADGKFVTRVIYLEDSRQALPARQDGTQITYETAPGQDPLAVADGLGRPVAILRLGGRLPSQSEAHDSTFYFGSPPFVALPADPAPPRAQPIAPPPTEHPVQTEPAAPPAAEKPTKVENLAPPPAETPKQEPPKQVEPKKEEPKLEQPKKEPPKQDELKEQESTDVTPAAPPKVNNLLPPRILPMPANVKRGEPKAEKADES